MRDVTYENPVLLWRNEANSQATAKLDPPPWDADLWEITRSEVVIRDQAPPVVNIWYAAVPAVPA